MATPSVTEPRFVPETDPRKWLDLYDNRTIFTELDPEILAAIPDNQLTWAVNDCLWNQLEVQEDWDRAIQDLRPGYAMIYHVLGLQGEVDNGGFIQFFGNPTGRYAYETFDACRRLGSEEIAAIVADAITLEQRIGVWYSQFPDAGVGTKVEFPDSAYAGYADLDDRFYSSKENLEALCNQYIRFHPDEFIGSIFPQAQ